MNIYIIFVYIQMMLALTSFDETRRVKERYVRLVL